MKREKSRLLGFFQSFKYSPFSQFIKLKMASFVSSQPSRQRRLETSLPMSWKIQRTFQFTVFSWKKISLSHKSSPNLTEVWGRWAGRSRVWLGSVTLLLGWEAPGGPVRGWASGESQWQTTSQIIRLISNTEMRCDAFISQETNVGQTYIFVHELSARDAKAGFHFDGGCQPHGMPSPKQTKQTNKIIKLIVVAFFFLSFLYKN